MKYPTTPPELSLALALNVENLRPWEWEMCEADRFYMVRDLRAVFDDARKDARASLIGD